jgi:hypothetical protein
MFEISLSVGGLATIIKQQCNDGTDFLSLEEENVLGTSMPLLLSSL